MKQEYAAIGYAFVLAKYSPSGEIISCSQVIGDDTRIQSPLCASFDSALEHVALLCRDHVLSLFRLLAMNKAHRLHYDFGEKILRSSTFSFFNSSALGFSVKIALGTIFSASLIGG
jgi:hypothetical protein